MARGLGPLAASVTCRVEAGVISGVGGLIRPHPKLAPGGPQGFARLIGSHPGEWPGAVHVDGWNTFKIPI